MGKITISDIFFATTLALTVIVAIPDLTKYIDTHWRQGVKTGDFDEGSCPPKVNSEEKKVVSLSDSEGHDEDFMYDMGADYASCNIL
mmetsp:Transcript_7390/g.8093  ORF Transcript_7390/g.8093 Transcript_7390/m.8093 type:complete len:87 (+) Transcript_7390:51-311(+)